MAKGKVSAAFSGLDLRPNGGGVVDVPAQFLEHAQDDALGEGPFAGKSAFAQARDDVGECGFEGHRDLTGRIHRPRLCPHPPGNRKRNSPSPIVGSVAVDGDA